MKHTKKVPQFNGSHTELAEQMGDLFYDSLADLLHQLADKIQADGKQDFTRERVLLATELLAASHCIDQAANHIEKAWTICEPHMQHYEVEE